MKFLIPAILWLGCIVYLNFIPSQDEFHLILPGLFGAFGSYIYLVRNSKEDQWKWLIILAVIARILIIPSFPNLSDDVYRFIWDGRLWMEGVHPFSVIPSEVVGTSNTLSQDIYDQLNSQEYFSIYPPIAQLSFFIAAFLGNGDLYASSLILKIIHASFDIGSIALIIALLKSYRMPRQKVFWYALNPLIVIELIGNLHHEVMVIFFVLLTLLYLRRSKEMIAGIALAGGIASKILPLMFVPLLFASLARRKGLLFLLSTGFTTLFLFWLIIPDWQVIRNLSGSADLYLRRFEFNGGVYYLLRALGFWIKGYNTIGIIGPLLSIVTVLSILALALLKGLKRLESGSLPVILMWTYCIYAFLSPTLHPWYIAILIALSVFTRFRFTILWSVLILLTYVNYSFQPYAEQLWVIALEYLCVLGFLLFEIERYGILDSKKIQKAEQ